MRKCNCGYGEGFYHTEPGGVHEFNPDVSPEQAVAEKHEDRQPAFIFFPAIMEPYVLLFRYPDGDDIKFRDINQGGREHAMKVAAAHVLDLAGQRS